MASGEFYDAFLKQTNRYLNPWSSGVTNFKDFRDCHFIIVTNLEKMKITEGALQLKLKFENVLSEKLVLIWMPVHDKKLIIDKNLDVSVE